MNKSLWLKVLFPFLAHLPLFTFFANNPFFKCPKSPHTTFRTIPLIDWKYLPDCWISVSSRHCWRWRRDANVLVHHLCLLRGLSSKSAHPGLSPASRRWTSMSYLLPPLTGSAEMVWYFILVNNVDIPGGGKHNSQDRQRGDLWRTETQEQWMYALIWKWIIKSPLLMQSFMFGATSTR